MTNERAGARSGVCRKCGCTDDCACDGGCYWADVDETLCSRCVRPSSLSFGVVKLKPAATLHVDCPWQFKDKLPGATRGAQRHYPGMTVEQLSTIELPPLADDVLMFFWRVASMQQEALDVIEAWGFELKSEIVWDKITSRGNPHFGMGRYTRASHEVCLLATRGRVKVRSRSVRSRFEAVVPKRHSEKPAEIFAIAERLYRGPRTELFGRAPRAGWQVLGNDPSLLWEAA